MTAIEAERRARERKRRWYEKNKKRLCQKQKQRFRDDPAFRARRIAQNKRRRANPDKRNADTERLARRTAKLREAKARAVQPIRTTLLREDQISELSIITLRSLDNPTYVVVRDDRKRTTEHWNREHLCDGSAVAGMRPPARARTQTLGG